MQHTPDEVLELVRQHYDRGEVASLLHGGGLAKALDKLAHAAALEASCFEQGKGAELQRLKDWLGDSLPVDWEAQRFKRYLETP